MDLNSVTGHRVKGCEIRNYPDEVYEAYPTLMRNAEYADPLSAVIELNSETGLLTIEGMQSDYVGRTPVEAGHDGYTNTRWAEPGILSAQVNWK